MSDSPWKARLYHIIFEADTRAGKAFDVLLILAILGSVAVSMLESVSTVQTRNAFLLDALEWGFTGLFAAEYFLRLFCSPRPKEYARSFFGWIDLLGWVPTVIGMLLPGAEILTTIRILRVLRVFRVLKMAAYLKEATVLADALLASRRKILVFLCFVLTLVTLLGSLMYVIEGPEHGFENIPVSVYWAIVTLTTVGYGDISPQTALGQFLSSFIMILGYAILAVPTGIVSTEFMRHSKPTHCPHCGKQL